MNHLKIKLHKRVLYSAFNVSLKIIFIASSWLPVRGRQIMEWGCFQTTCSLLGYFAFMRSAILHLWTSLPSNTIKAKIVFFSKRMTINILIMRDISYKWTTRRIFQETIVEQGLNCRMKVDRSSYDKNWRSGFLCRTPPWHNFLYLILIVCQIHKNCIGAFFLC